VNNGTFQLGFRRWTDRHGRDDDAPYNRGGTFTVTLSVTSDSRATSTSSRTINVSTTLPADDGKLQLLADDSRDQSGVTVHARRPPRVQDFREAAGRYKGARYQLGLRRRKYWAREFDYAPVHRAPGRLRSRFASPTTPGCSRDHDAAGDRLGTLPAGSADFVFSPTDPRVGDVVFFNGSLSSATNASYCVGLRRRHQWIGSRADAFVSRWRERLR
jgi:hypothetical protein